MKMNEIRIRSQDFTIVGAHSPQGQTFSARVFAPLAEALASKTLFAGVNGGIQVLDTIRLSRTDAGSLKWDQGNRAYETVELMVVGFDGKLPVVRQISDIMNLEDLFPNRPLMMVGHDPRLPASGGITMQPTSAPAKTYNDIHRAALSIVEEKTGQGRGKPALITYLVKDGLGNVLNQFKDREGAEGFVDAYQSEAA